MKRLSCPGCERCNDYVEDDIREHLSCDKEGILVFGEKLHHQDLVYLAGVIDSHDWESGHPDAWHYEVRHYTPPDVIKP